MYLSLVPCASWINYWWSIVIAQKLSSCWTIDRTGRDRISSRSSCPKERCQTGHRHGKPITVICRLLTAARRSLNCPSAVDVLSGTVQPSASLILYALLMYQLHLVLTYQSSLSFRYSFHKLFSIKRMLCHSFCLCLSYPTISPY